MHSTFCEELNNYIGDLENLYTPHVRCEVLGHNIDSIYGHKGISTVRYRRVARGLLLCPYTARKPPRCPGAP